MKSYRPNVFLSFNQTCLNKGLLPNYTNFKMHDPTDPDDTDTRMYRYSLLKRLFDDNEEKINTLKHLSVKLKDFYH